MPLLHIANTDLEFELTDPLPLEKGLVRNPIVHQLQYLPLIYAGKDEGVGVTHLLPDERRCHLLTEPHLPFTEVESWGPSQAVANWAKMKGLTYHMPPWDVVKTVNSKAFSFQQAAPLPSAQLITTWEELEQWLNTTDGPRVLKNCFGLSGQGHLFLPATPEKIKAFAQREFIAGRPIIAEPWVMRKLDFSTQWIIHPDQSITYEGATILVSDEKGRYQGNQIGPEEKIFGFYFHQLQSQKQTALHTLTHISTLGFFGNVGFDAMIWGDNILHPIVEINARKTMGWVALQIRKRLFSNQTIRVSYMSQKRENPLLPESVDGINFPRNLYVLAE